MNRPALQAVLFDLDGTLLDTAPDFQAIVNQLRAEHALPPLDFSDIRQTVSDGARALAQRALALEEAHPDIDAARQRLLQLYQARLCVDTRPFPGIPETLTRLHAAGRPWGCVTNKPEQYAAPLLAAVGLQPPCGSLVCPDHVSARKPDPESLWVACRQLNVMPEACLYIGDHRRDIEAGRNAGMRTASAAYGYRRDTDDPDDWGADYRIDDSRDLPALITHWLEENNP